MRGLTAAGVKAGVEAVPVTRSALLPVPAAWRLFVPAMPGVATGP